MKWREIRFNLKTQHNWFPEWDANYTIGCEKVTGNKDLLMLSSVLNTAIYMLSNIISKK